MSSLLRACRPRKKRTPRMVGLACSCHAGWHHACFYGDFSIARLMSMPMPMRTSVNDKTTRPNPFMHSSSSRTVHQHQQLVSTDSRALRSQYHKITNAICPWCNFSSRVAFLFLLACPQASHLFPSSTASRTLGIVTLSTTCMKDCQWFGKTLRRLEFISFTPVFCCGSVDRCLGW